VSDWHRDLHVLHETNDEDVPDHSSASVSETVSTIIEKCAKPNRNNDVWTLSYTRSCILSKLQILVFVVLRILFCCSKSVYALHVCLQTTTTVIVARA